MKANLKVTSWYLLAQSKLNAQNVGTGAQQIPTYFKILHSFFGLNHNLLINLLAKHELALIPQPTF